MAIRKFLAIFLLLVFLQKSGMGMVFHNAFHATEDCCSGSNTVVKTFSCSCVDDFLLLYTQADGLLITKPFPVLTVVNTFFTENIHFTCTAFIALRGPPASIA